MSETSKANIENMATKLANALTDYSQDVADAVKDVVEEVADDTVSELKKVSPRLTGVYAKGWRKKKAYEADYEKRNTVHNRRKYQLTHLLERPHAKVSTDRARRRHNLGTTRPKIHIAPVEEKAVQQLEDKITKAVGKI